MNDLGEGIECHRMLPSLSDMQCRQDFVREYIVEDPVPFVGGFSLRNDNLRLLGQGILRALELENGWPLSVATWQEAENDLIKRIEKLGIVVSVDYVISHWNAKKEIVYLDTDGPPDFLGFAMVDRGAPMIWVNRKFGHHARVVTIFNQLLRIAVGLEYKGDVIPSRTHHRVVIKMFHPFLERLGNLEHRVEPMSFKETQIMRLGKIFSIYIMGAALQGRVSFKEAYAITSLPFTVFEHYGRLLGYPFPK